MFRKTLAGRYGMILLLVTTLVGVTVLSVNLYYLNRFHDHSLGAAQDKLNAAVEAQLTRDARLIATTLTGNLDLAVYQRDFSAMQELLEGLSETASIDYVYIYDRDGRVIHDGSLVIEHYGRRVEELLPPGLGATLEAGARKIGRFIHIAEPISAGGEAFAAVRFAIEFQAAESDLEQLNQKLAKEQQRQRNHVLLATLLVLAVVWLLTLPLIYWMVRQLFRPMQELSEQSRRFGAGDRDASFLLQREDELGQLASALQEMKGQIEQNQARIRDLAYRDSLTQLPNRRLFQEELATLMAWADREGQRLALLFIDLDHFKQVNDSAGHELGDLLLQKATQRLLHLVRQSLGRDALPVASDRLLARLGGDEFVLLLPGIQEQARIAGIAEAITRMLSETFILDGRHFRVSASIGITQYPQDGATASDLLKHADIAMYATKQAGRSGYKFFEPEMNRQMLDRILILQGVEAGLENGDFALEYQPLYALRSQRLVGAEVLVRWQHPQKGLIMPGDFIPLLEHSEQIVPLTLWILRQACRDLQQRILPLRPDFSLAINVAGNSLNSPRIRRKIAALIRHHRLPPGALHLEITETSMMQDLAGASDILQQLKALGVDIWIDDFGTGYSSLSYLHSLPIDGFKIDRSFIQRLGSGQSSQMVEAMLALAASLQLKTVSEGIETRAQLQLLRQLGCDIGQGYGLARPAPLQQLIRELEQEPALYETL